MGAVWVQHTHTHAACRLLQASSQLVMHRIRVGRGGLECVFVELIGQWNLLRAGTKQLFKIAAAIKKVVLNTDGHPESERGARRLVPDLHDGGLVAFGAVPNGDFVALFSSRAHGAANFVRVANGLANDREHHVFPQLVQKRTAASRISAHTLARSLGRPTVRRAPPQPTCRRWRFRRPPTSA